MTTSQPSPPGGSRRRDPRSTWSAPGSPASPSPQPANARRKRIRAGSGRRLPDAFAYYDPASCSWRTSQGSLLEASARFSATWPTSGMTRNGTAYLRPTSARRTSVAASSSSPTWPTPTVSRSRNRTSRRRTGRRHHDGITLLDAVRLWPTPAARDAKGTFPATARGATGKGGPDLTTAAAGRWPTPTAADADRQSPAYPRGNQTLAGAARWPTPKASATHQGRPRPQDRGDLQAAVLWPTPTAANPNDRETLASFQQRRRREQAKGRNGNGMGTPLAVAVRLWPTPTTADGHSGPGHTPTAEGTANLRTTAGSGLLNPAWVEALMGLPAGWTVPPLGWKAPRGSRAGQGRQATPSSTGSRPAPSPAASPTAPGGSPRSATPSSPRSPRSPAAGP